MLRVAATSGAGAVAEVEDWAARLAEAVSAAAVPSKTVGALVGFVGVTAKAAAEVAVAYVAAVVQGIADTKVGATAAEARWERLEDCKLEDSVHRQTRSEEVEE